MTQKEQQLSNTDVEWINEQLPVSTRFDDAYFSKVDGRKETLHTFIEGNRLPQRWPDMEHCAIGELGFGTGLNFLETVRHWQAFKKPDAKLHFISFEQYPMDRQQIEKALSPWPELTVLQQQLTNIWNPKTPILSAQFSDSVKLTTYFGDVNQTLPDLNLQIDAWYLDGFSPAKNPDMWSETLMQAVFDNSKPGVTLATYSAAGWVRKNLETAGFIIEKTSGFAGKRDMTIGRRLSP